VTELTRIQMVVFLQSCDLFSHCKADEILRISGIAQERRLQQGTRIYATSDAADELYCVVQGEVELKGADGSGRSVGTLGTFGVREILCGKLRAEEAVVAEETLLLAIEAEDFFDLLSNNIEIVKALFRHLLHEPSV
jgi:CRP-like cAMP-binding protein